MQLCLTYGLKPSKEYGQNYLINPLIIEKIIESANLQKTDTVVEIGPGFGSLTLAMAPYVKKLLAFEIEKKILPYWEQKQKEVKNIEIVWGNVLREIKENEILPVKYKVVANIPYQITSNLIREFLEAKNKPTQMTLMVQKEVAIRICAKRGDMSVLAVAVQYYATPEIITLVSRNNFFPVPNVDSAVLHLEVFNFKPASDTEDFFRLVKVGFASRRKTLIKNLLSLKYEKEKLQKIFTELGFDLKIRAQELTVEDWRSLLSRLSTKTD